MIHANSASADAAVENQIFVVREEVLSDFLLKQSLILKLIMIKQKTVSFLERSSSSSIPNHSVLGSKTSFGTGHEADVVRAVTNFLMLFYVCPC